MQIGRSRSFKSSIVGLAGGWNFDFMYELQLGSFTGSPSAPNATLALVAPDGTAYDFVMQPGGTFVPDTATGAFYAPTNLKVEYVGTLPSDLSTLQSAATQWRVTDGDDATWVFQTFTRPNTSTPYAVGRPITKTTRNGYTWNFAYRTDTSLQTVTDSFGRQATFNWALHYISSLANPPAGSLPYPEAVASVSLPDGTSLRYTYDPPPAAAPPSTSIVQRLVKVERLNAVSVAVDSTTYTYGDARFPQYITAITDFSGNQIASFAYGSNARAASTAHANGADAHGFATTETTSEVVASVTNPLGRVEDYHFQKTGTGLPDLRLTSIVGDASANTPASTKSITYGSDNFIASETDEEGRITNFTRDNRGRPTTVVEAYGTPQARTTTITWDSAFNLPDRMVRPGLQVDYTYYSNGQLQTRMETDTTTGSVPYSTNGQTRTWAYTWGGGGRLASINGPKPVDGTGRDDTLAYGYDTTGNLQTVTNGLGQATAFGGYDANGRPATMTDANGIVTGFTYDTLGRTKTITVKHPTNSSLDAVTSFDYDAHDRVVDVTLPSTDELFLDYNSAGQLTDMRAASGERRDYTYDSDGNVTSETVRRPDISVSQQISRSFDELGRLLTEAQIAPNTNHYSYDKVGNLTGITAPNSNATSQAFDPLNRMISTVAPDGGKTNNTYDALDNVATSADPISVTTQFTRDGFGDVIQEISPDRGTSVYYYNQAGELTASIDGRGQRIDYTRDILGRVTQIAPAGRPSSETITYAWDTPGISGSYGVGRLSSVTDGTGTTSFAYDHRGNLLTKRQTIGTGTADLAYTYDLADRVTQITYPSGRIVQYAYDTKGRVSQVQTKAPSDPGWTVLASSYTYEPFGAVKTIAFGNGLTLTNDWGNDGRLASKRLSVMSSGSNLSWLTYNYDANGNIGAVRDALNDANSIYYGYDANDRLTLASMVLASAPSAESYTYNSGTNQLATLTDSTGTRSVTYDGRGNTSGETRPGGASVSTTYDGYARLLTYTRTGDPAQANSYNGLDDRVSVTSGSTTHEFVYDTDGRVMGEYGASATDVVAETIWMSPTSDSGAGEFGGDDGVGGYAPLAIAAGSGASSSLDWVHGDHLGVPLFFADASGAVVAAPSYAMVGFPGQTKTLSDVYYNKYRDYDSSIGRYIQADPIGLSGGGNPYLYAEANPLRYRDPSGLSAWTIPLELGSKVGIRMCPECWGALAMAPYVYQGGQVIGGAIGSGTNWLRGCPNQNDPCAEKYAEIELRANSLRRRLIEFRRDDWNLPEFNPPGVKGRTRIGEAQAFYDEQAGLRRALKEANELGCKDIPPDAWALATMPLDSRYPRPIRKYLQ
jgi:RHS repeat-associated protein